jgi:hypothetical protein
MCIMLTLSKDLIYNENNDVLSGTNGTREATENSDNDILNAKQ